MSQYALCLLCVGAWMSAQVKLCFSEYNIYCRLERFSLDCRKTKTKTKTKTNPFRQSSENRSMLMCPWILTNINLGFLWLYFKNDSVHLESLGSFGHCAHSL